METLLKRPCKTIPNRRSSAPPRYRDQFNIISAALCGAILFYRRARLVIYSVVGIQLLFNKPMQDLVYSPYFFFIASKHDAVAQIRENYKLTAFLCNVMRGDSILLFNISCRCPRRPGHLADGLKLYGASLHSYLGTGIWRRAF